jgi:hypothetical protein
MSGPLAPTLQFDPGTFNLVQNNVVVGSVFVETTNNPNLRLEHYTLYPSYISPSWSSGGGSQDDLTIRKVHYSDLSANATTVRPGGVHNFGDYLAVMNDRQGSGPAYVYIKADCLSGLLPS